MSNDALREIEQIVGHLGAALTQALPTDDQIIIGHVRDANEIALKMFKDMRLQNQRAVTRILNDKMRGI